jgi:hypothetical protein
MIRRREWARATTRWRAARAGAEARARGGSCAPPVTHPRLALQRGRRLDQQPCQPAEGEVVTGGLRPAGGVSPASAGSRRP